MKCDKCARDKLSNEFPPFHITEDCRHAKLICLRCVVEASENNERCPFDGCSGIINSASIELCRSILDQMFEEAPSCSNMPAPCQDKPGGGYITIVMLTGKQLWFEHRPDMYIRDINNAIYKETGISTEKQKLVYDNKELKEMVPNKAELTTLKYYNIPCNATIRLLTLLYEIKAAMNKVTFQLEWGFPESGRSSLDACCFIFQGSQCMNIIHYTSKEQEGVEEKVKLPWYKAMFRWTGLIQTTRRTVAVEHLGDNNYDNKGSQIINVILNKLDKTITHLFFTLSARDSPNIGQFKSPTLKFYEEGKPNEKLCSTTFNHAKNSSAVVICSLERSLDTTKGWLIYNSGKLSPAQDFDELAETLQQIIQNGQ